MRFSLAAAAAVTAALLCAPAAGAADQICGPASAKTAVIVIHGGGFLFGSPQGYPRECAKLGARGYYAVNIDYPLGDLGGAEKYLHDTSVRLRSRYRQVFAYGESAGGGLAALAAARRWVDRAFAWAPVTDLVSWQAEAQPGFVHWEVFKDSSVPTLRRLSAVTWASARSAPILILHGTADTLVPIAQSYRLALKWPSMTLWTGPGGHYPDEPTYLIADEIGARYLDKYRLAAGAGKPGKPGRKAAPARH